MSLSIPNHGRNPARDGRLPSARLVPLALGAALACAACRTVEPLPECHGPSRPINVGGSAFGSPTVAAPTGGASVDAPANKESDRARR